MGTGIGLGLGLGRRGGRFPRKTVERAYEGTILVAAVVDFLGTVPYGDRIWGDRIRLVEPAWRAILLEIEKDPETMFRFAARKWEEIIAAAYDAEGYDVILTPRSGDGGVDVVAVSTQGPRVRIFDQVKAYAPGRRVDADDVRALMGVVAHSDATKGVVTTTSEFAPRVREDPFIRHAISTGLELVDGAALRGRLLGLRRSIK